MCIDIIFVFWFPYFSAAAAAAAALFVLRQRGKFLSLELRLGQVRLAAPQQGMTREKKCRYTMKLEL
jgi:hypothetical protein